MSPVLPVRQAAANRGSQWSVVLAFLAIYLIWGSTFLAIKLAVAIVPPFFAAGVRFAMAGLLLLGYAYLRGISMPTPREWRSLAISASILFVPSYGGLFWAEKTVPSGIASAMVATIPVWIALAEVFVLRHSRLRWPLAASLLCGVSGVSILALRTTVGGSHSVLPYLVILMSQITWTIGTLLTKNMKLPHSKTLVSGVQMTIAGLLLLILSGVAGELNPLPHVTTTATLAILYLAIPGSVVAFTAYVFLISKLPASTVGSYAYVNPVVALALGFWLGHESLDLRVMAGTALILIAVVLTLRGSLAA